MFWGAQKVLRGRLTVGRKGQSTVFCTIHVTSFHGPCMSCGVCDAGYCEYYNFRFFVCFSSSFSHLLQLRALYLHFSCAYYSVIPQHKLKPIKDAGKAVTIVHQNSCGLPNKKEELLYSLLTIQYT